MANSGSITVTNHRLRKAMSNLNDDDFKAQTKQMGDKLKSELKLQIGRVIEICSDTETATVKIVGSNRKETCLIAHDIFSEGVGVDSFPKGKTEVRHKKHYITPSDKLYGVICTVDDNGKDKKVLLSYINRKNWNNLDRCKAGEYKVQVGDNTISLTDKYIKINSDNLFINGLPYNEPKFKNHYSKKEIQKGMKDFVDVIYPVGSIYMSINDTNPSKLFGGEWERIKDRFLLGSGDTYANGSTGGSADSVVVKHNHEQNPHQHAPNRTDGAFVTRDNTKTHGIGESRVASGTSFYVPDIASDDNWWGSTITANATATNKETGVDGTGKNMPPYMAVYMWKRLK